MRSYYQGGQQVNEEQDDLLGIGPAARYMQMSPDWLRRHAAEVGYLWMGGQRRFRRSDLDAYLERARRDPTPAEVSAS